MSRAPLLLLCLLLGSLASCAHGYRETRPEVTLKANASGLECSAFEYRAAHCFVGQSWDVEGRPHPPDVPPGMWAGVKRSNPAARKPGRYLLRSSGRLSVVSVESPELYTTRYHAAGKKLDELRKGLFAGDVKGLCTLRGEDEIPWMNASPVFHGKARIEQFPWGPALMFLTHYVQDGSQYPVNSDSMVLVVQGLTRDGRYAVHGHFDMRHPRLPDNLDETRKQAAQKGRVYFDLVNDKEAAEAWLGRQPDEDFDPGFQQYKALLAALEIKPGPVVSTRPVQKETPSKSDGMMIGDFLRSNNGMPIGTVGQDGQ